MIRTGMAVLAGAIFAGVATAQIETSVATLPSGTALNAELNSTVDSKKAKAGDKIEAHTTEAVKYDGKIILPNGAKLIGHIVQAAARSKGDNDSALTIQIDKAVPKKGEELPLNVTIVAIAAPMSDLSAASMGPGSDPMADRGAAAAGGSPMGASRPQNAGPGASIPNSAPAGTANPPDALAGGPGSGRLLPATSRGAIGMHGVSLTGRGSNTSQGAVITSTGKSVRLDSGTRMLLISQAGLEATPGK